MSIIVYLSTILHWVGLLRFCMENTLDVGICGCGIGGLAVASLLAKQGHRVTLFERFNQPAPVGSGLVLQPVGQAVLSKIGMLEALRLEGRIITRLRGHIGGRKRPVLDVTYGVKHGLGLHRSVLFNTLLQAALDAGAVLKTNRNVVALTKQSDKPQLQFEDGGKSPPFDLVIDASGAGSNLSPIKTRSLPFGALWANVNWPENTLLPSSELTQRYHRASVMAGVLPMGKAHGADCEKAAIFWSLPIDQYARWRAGSLDDWLAQATQHWPDFAPFINQIKRHGDFTFACYSHGTLARPIAHRLAFIGDAAHCASPQLGQGANMALLDAYALAEALRRHSLEQALPVYARARRLHVATYQAVSYLFTPLYQSNSSIAPIMRDNLFAPLARIPPMPMALSRLVSGNLVPPMRADLPAPCS